MKKYKHLLFSSLCFAMFFPASSQTTLADSEHQAEPEFTHLTNVSLERNQATIHYQRNKEQTNSHILHAVWSDENGQDDLKWYTAGEESTAVDLRNHQGYGTYHVHTYIHIDGKMIGLNTTHFTLEKAETSVTTQISGDQAHVLFQRNREQINSHIIHAVWSEENGQDDLKWYTAGEESTAVDLKNHRGYGTYNVHTYEHKNGQMIGLYGTTFILEKPDPIIETSFPETGIMEILIKNLPSTMYKVVVPTWSDHKGQDDIQWYQATQNPDGTYRVRVELKKHHFDTGVYHIHLYGESYVQPAFTGLAGTSLEVGAEQLPSEEERKPLCSIEHINEDRGTYTVKIAETAKSKTIQSVRVPVWSTSNQSNIKWYQADNHGDGTFTVPFDIHHHQTLSGTYHNHVYIKYADNSEEKVLLDSVPLSAERLKASVSIQKRSPQQYEVTVVDAYGDGEILLPTWSEENGQDDIQWYTAHKTGAGTYTYTINTQKHNSSGLFHTHVYRRVNGQMIGVTTANFQVDKPAQAILYKPDYAGAATYPVGQCTWGAKVLAPWAGPYWGNGGQWGASARQAGFKTGTTA